MKFNADESFKTAQFQKGDIVLRKGDIAKYGYKVLKGLLRSYIIDASGKEHIMQFAPEGWLISDMDSFFNNVPASMYIDAIEPTEVLLLNRTDFEQIENLEKSELINQMHVLRRNVIALHKRMSLLLSSTSQERYLEFLTTYPKLVNRIPLKFIASYIGVTPEYLSEIRRKIIRP